MAGRNPEQIHAWVEERLSAYMDGNLNPNEHAQIENHLRECAGCRTSLESLRWTLSLIKQVPAPKLSRSFTLPVPVKRESSFGFVALRFATVAATLLLFALIATDVLTQFGTVSAPAPTGVALRAPLQEQASATKAAAPTSAPLPPAPAAINPTSAPAAPRPTSAPMPTKALEPTKAAAQAALPTSAPKPSSIPTTNATEITRTPLNGLGSAPVETATAVADSTSKVTQSAAAPRVVASPTLASTATIVPSPTPTASPSPTVTATHAPTATNVPTRVAVAQPTLAPALSTKPVSQPNPITPMRVAQFALLFVVVFLGALMLLLRRR